jgi:hypothetical protein
MGYKLDVDGFEGQDIEVVVSFWTGARLFVNGKKAEKGPRRGQLVLKRNDGKEVIASFKHKNIWADVPQLKVGKELIEFAKPLTWKEWIFVGSPIVVLLLGGALGAVMAMLGLYLNGKLFRSQLKDVLKYTLSAVVTLSLIIGYFFFSSVILLLFNN